jgi:hypothetical protein
MWSQSGTKLIIADLDLLIYRYHCCKNHQCEGDLLLKNPSEYINIGRLNIHQLKKTNQHFASKNYHMPQKITTCLFTTRKIWRCLQKTDIYLDFIDLYLPVNFIFYYLLHFY